MSLIVYVECDGCRFTGESGIRLRVRGLCGTLRGGTNTIAQIASTVRGSEFWTVFDGRHYCTECIASDTHRTLKNKRTIIL